MDFVDRHRLTPRIGSFIEQHPELEVELLSSNTLVDFGAEEVDVALRMGGGQYPGLYVERLLDDVFFPVCSPNFNGGRLPELPAHMAGMPLLRGEGDPWKPWFEAAGLDWQEPTKGLLLQDSSLLLQAAAEGQGIALIRSSLAYNDLLSGRVVPTRAVGGEPAGRQGSRGLGGLMQRLRRRQDERSGA